MPFVFFEQSLHVFDMLIRVASGMRHQDVHLGLPNCVGELRATTRLSENKSCQRLYETAVHHTVKEPYGHCAVRPVVEQEASLGEVPQVKTRHRGQTPGNAVHPELSGVIFNPDKFARKIYLADIGFDL